TCHRIHRKWLAATRSGAREHSRAPLRVAANRNSPRELRQPNVFANPRVPVAEHARLDLETVLVDHFQHHALALRIVLFALRAFLALGDGVVEFLLVDLAVVAGEGVDEILDLTENAAFEDVAVALAHLGQRRARRIDGDALLQSDLQDFAF